MRYARHLQWSLKRQLFGDRLGSRLAVQENFESVQDNEQPLRIGVAGGRCTTQFRANALAFLR
jgi:hypothetical protein